MPPVAKQKFARSHEDSLLVVCAACWRKNKNVRSITDNMAELIRKHVYKDFTLRNGYHPSVVCDGCRKTISDFEKVGAFLSAVPPCTKTVTKYFFCLSSCIYIIHSRLFKSFLYRMGRTPRDIFLQHCHMQI